MKRTDLLDERLLELREAFDSSFARPWAAERAEPNAILCFTVAGHRFAAPLAELQSIAKAGPIVPVPSRSSALLGLTVVRARLMPVFSLTTLLGLPGSGSDMCWLVVLRGRFAAAVPVDALVGYADRASVSDVPAGSGPRFVRGAVRHGEEMHALLDAAGIYDALTRGSADWIGHQQQGKNHDQNHDQERDQDQDQTT